MASLVSINVGRAQRFEIGAKPFRSAILKSPIEGRVRLGTLGVAGDQQADHRFHGGPEKAVLLYTAEHYDYWQRVLKSAPLPPGTFGDNLTLSGFADLEGELHVGDVLAIGGATGEGENGATDRPGKGAADDATAGATSAAKIQLTTPRQPCWKLETRMGISGFAKAFLESGRIGIYARVVAEGEIGAGDRVTVAEHAPTAATLRDLIRALYFEDREAAARVLVDTGLDPRLRKRLLRGRDRSRPEEG